MPGPADPHLPLLGSRPPPPRPPPRLFISVLRLGDLVAHFCQPSKNVFENKMTSFQ